MLRIPPDAFWRMTLRELALAIAAVRPHVSTALPRGELAALMARFPDARSTETQHGG